MTENDYPSGLLSEGYEPAAEPAQPASEPTADDISVMSVDAAKAEIKKTMSAAIDPQHPYCNHMHIDHKSSVARMADLFTVAAGPAPEPQVNEAGQEISNPLPQKHFDAMAEALENKGTLDEAAQQKLIEGTKEDMRILVQDFDYEDSSIPDDLTVDLAALVKMQRLNEQANYDALRPMLNSRMVSQHVPAENLQLFNGLLNTTNIDLVCKKEIVSSFLASLDRARLQNPNERSLR